MSKLNNQDENIIRGSCADFVCRSCRTKCGWPHQMWCDHTELTEPGCPDCAYYNSKRDRCNHPVKNRKWRDAG